MCVGVCEKENVYICVGVSVRVHAICTFVSENMCIGMKIRNG